MKKDYPKIFEPLTIKRMTLKNRVVMTPMGTNYAEPDGELSMLHLNYYDLRAKGGVGLINVENANVDFPLGSNGTSQIRIDHDSFLPRFYKLTELIHQQGGCACIQINHAGASAQSFPRPISLPKTAVKFRVLWRRKRFTKLLKNTDRPQNALRLPDLTPWKFTVDTPI